MVYIQLNVLMHLALIFNVFEGQKMSRVKILDTAV